MHFLCTDASRDWPPDSAAVWLYRRRGADPIKKSWWRCFHRRNGDVMRASRYISIRRMAQQFDLLAARAAMDAVMRSVGATA